MKQAKWLYVSALFVAASCWVATANAQEPSQSEQSGSGNAENAQERADDQWLHTVWSQIDEMVQQEEYGLQQTVTGAAVRGTEAKDDILDKLYYKGSKRYPSQDKLKKAIETLKEAIEEDPEAEDVPKQRFFIAQCYEKLGKQTEAVAGYEQVTKAHPNTTWARKSQERLDQLGSAE